MRLLSARTIDVSVSTAHSHAASDVRADRRCDERQLVPMRNVSAHQAGHPAGSGVDVSGLRLSRRALIELGLGAGAAFVLEFSLGTRTLRAARPSLAEPFRPNAWLAIDETGDVTITVAKSEMGQGVWTTLPMLIAEELDVEWSRVRVRQADAEIGSEYQNTGGSSSTVDSWDMLRRAGAAARQMLLTAAAARWNVAPIECSTSAGRVMHGASNRSVPYEELIADARSVPVPDPGSVSLRDPAEFKIIGRRLSRLDTPLKISGQAIYGIDVRVPGMLYAVVARCPYLGGRLESHDGAKALLVPGVRHVLVLRSFGAPLHLRGGVAVVADSTWAAMEGRRALSVTWSPGPNSAVSSASINESFHAAAATRGKVTSSSGDVDAAFASAAPVVAAYEYPYLAHATMEPNNCTVALSGGRAEVWAPTQYPPNAQAVAAAMLQMDPALVTLHVPFLGGGFGRRINEDFVAEAALLARLAGATVQVLWTRDDDLQHDFYRQAGLQQMRATLGADGFPTAIERRVIGPSVNAFYTRNHPSPEGQELWGTAMVYAVPNHRIEYVQVASPVPVGWWRSVSVSQNVFCLEAFVSELAVRAGQDPLDYRKAMLRSDARAVTVLDRVASLSNWGSAPANGRARGVAFANYDGTYVAQVVEASLTARGDAQVHNVSCVIDCGQVVNPGIVEAQAEGSIIWGLNAALLNEITVANGAPQQRDFVDYPLMRMRDTPDLRIEIVPSREVPTGAGEPCVVPVAPALAAAIGRLRGQPARSMPFNKRRAG